MNLIDVCIILFFITSLIRGVELGVLRQAFSTIGLIAGLFLGVFIQGKVIHLAHTPAIKALLALVIIATCIGVLSAGCEYVGMLLRQRIERAKRLKLLDRADRAVGSIVAGVTLLVTVWLIAAIFTNVPIQALQRQTRSSVIIAQMNKSLPAAPQIVTKLGHLIDPNGIPNVFAGLEPKIDTSTPLPSIGDLDSAVTQDRDSVVKIEGVSCGGISEGSGFVADTGMVVTNAHVVAGVKQPYVIDANGKHSTSVIWFDPNLDLAVLRTSNLSGRPLAMLGAPVDAGTPAAALGYPGGGGFTAKPATVLDSFNARGRDIYNQGETERGVYSIKADIKPGNSGGPLIDKNSQVIGIVFAESTTYDKVGYALAMNQVIDEFNQAKNNHQTVGTGSCTE